jgi:hypothetical protein
MIESSNKTNGTPMRVERDDTGGLPFSYHLSYVVNNSIKGFWERRGMEEPGCDSRMVYGKYGGGGHKNERKGK